MIASTSLAWSFLVVVRSFSSAVRLCVASACRRLRSFAYSSQNTDSASWSIRLFCSASRTRRSRSAWAMVAMFRQRALPLLRAVEQPKEVCDTFENPLPQLPQVSSPENSVRGRRRSQIGVLVFFVFIAP